MSSKTDDVFDGAIQFLEKGWCRIHSVVDSNGDWVEDPLGPEAAAWCMLGALDASHQTIRGDDSDGLWETLYNATVEALPYPYRSVSEFNDTRKDASECIEVMRRAKTLVTVA